jgi:hypothetical protein
VTGRNSDTEEVEIPVATAPGTCAFVRLLTVFLEELVEEHASEEVRV